MHAGVVRDMELLRVKQERQQDFEAQQSLEREYLKGQSVRDGSNVVGEESAGGGTT